MAHRVFMARHPQYPAKRYFGVTSGDSVPTVCCNGEELVVEMLHGAYDITHAHETRAQLVAMFDSVHKGYNLGGDDDLLTDLLRDVDAWQCPAPLAQCVPWKSPECNDEFVRAVLEQQAEFAAAAGEGMAAVIRWGTGVFLDGVTYANLNVAWDAGYRKVLVWRHPGSKRVTAEKKSVVALEIVDWVAYHMIRAAKYAWEHSLDREAMAIFLKEAFAWTKHGFAIDIVCRRIAEDSFVMLQCKSKASCGGALVKMSTEIKRSVIKLLEDDPHGARKKAYIVQKVCGIQPGKKRAFAKVTSSEWDEIGQLMSAHN